MCSVEFELALPRELSAAPTAWQMARHVGRVGGRGAGRRVGTVAPDVTLSPPAGMEGEAVTLSAFKGKKPVALIFGSYT